MNARRIANLFLIVFLVFLSVNSITVHAANPGSGIAITAPIASADTTFLSPELQQFIVTALVALVLGTCAVLAMFAVTRIIGLIRQRWPNSPGIELILTALTPYIYKAIMAGERAAVWGFDQLENGIAATDKKKVADSVYNLIPDTITIGKWTITSDFVKRLIPPDEWQRWVKTKYDEADAFLQRNETYLKGQIKQLKELTPAA